MLESKIEQKCIALAKALGVESIKLSIQSNVGFPDRLFFLDGGKPLFVEFKRQGGKLSDKQQHNIAFLRQKGYAVSVCDSFESFQKTMRNALK